MNKFIVSVFVIVFIFTELFAENGYDVWLNYRPVGQISLKNAYTKLLSNVFLPENGPATGAMRNELLLAADRLTGIKAKFIGQKGHGINFLLLSGVKAAEMHKTSMLANSNEGFVMEYTGNALNIMATGDSACWFRAP